MATIIGRWGVFASQIFDTGGLKSRQIGSSTAPPQKAQKLWANFRENNSINKVKGGFSSSSGKYQTVFRGAVSVVYSKSGPKAITICFFKNLKIETNELLDLVFHNFKYFFLWILFFNLLLSILIPVWALFTFWRNIRNRQAFVRSSHVASQNF